MTQTRNIKIEFNPEIIEPMKKMIAFHLGIIENAKRMSESEENRKKELLQIGIKGIASIFQFNQDVMQQFLNLPGNESLKTAVNDQIRYFKNKYRDLLPRLKKINSTNEQEERTDQKDQKDHPNRLFHHAANNTKSKTRQVIYNTSISLGLFLGYLTGYGAILGLLAGLTSGKAVELLKENCCDKSNEDDQRQTPKNK